MRRKTIVRGIGSVLAIALSVATACVAWKWYHPMVPHGFDFQKEDSAIFKAVLENRTSDDGHSFVIVRQPIQIEIAALEFADGFHDGHAWAGEANETGPEMKSPSRPFGFSQPLSVWRELNESFETRQRRAEPLVRFPSKRQLVWVPREQLDAIFERGFWDEFHNQFPHSIGCVNFSAPGYSRDGKLAIVYFSSSYGGRGGQGDFYLLQHRIDGWHIVQVLQDWVS